MCGCWAESASTLLEIAVEGAAGAGRLMPHHLAAAVAEDLVDLPSGILSYPPCSPNAPPAKTPTF